MQEEKMDILNGITTTSLTVSGKSHFEALTQMGSKLK